MFLPDFKVSWELQWNVILHCNTSFTLEHFYLQCSSMFSLVCYGYLTLFEYKRRIKIFKKGANEDIINLLLNGPNFMWNVIIIPMLPVMAFLEVTKMYIFQLTKCEHKGVSKSIDSDNRNLPAWSFDKFYNFSN